MSKRRYSTTEFKKVDWQMLSTRVCDQRVVFAIDVAKNDFVAAVMCNAEQAEVLIKWTHPDETSALLQALTGLAAKSPVEAVMESSGTYGDALRWQLRQAGLSVFRASAKRVHDAAEVFDGVPSLHDAKAAYLIGRLHFDGATQLWTEVGVERRQLLAHLTLLGLYKERYRAGLNRLEAQLSRHWPESLRLIGLRSVTLATLVQTYGDPAHIAQDEAGARAMMHRIGHRPLGVQKVEQLLECARKSLGVPCLEAERQLLQTLAADALTTRKQLRHAEACIKELVHRDCTLERMAAVVGETSSAVLLASLGHPQDYANATSYLKGLGLNLKERSSGKHRGQLRITKRGPSVARFYLYYAALRYIARDPVVKRWYAAKTARAGAVPGKVIVALMRKLLKALWYVARGAKFDSNQLFDLAAVTGP